MKSQTEFYAGKRLLVTGGSGFLATNLAAALRDDRCSVRMLSRSSSYVSLPAGLYETEHLTGDISEETVWQRALHGVDMVFHFAGQTSVYAANESPAADLRSNVLPMLHMLEACRKKNLRPVILFAGTVTEAGLVSTLPADESCQDRPVTVYDLHKLMAENYLKYYVKQGTVKGAVLRLANVYGPGPESSGAGRGVLNTMIRKALGGEALTIYGEGNYIRDYIYVADVVDAFLCAGAAADRLNGRHFVIGSGRGHSISEMVNMVSKQVGQKSGRAVPIRNVAPPPALSPIEERNFVADTRAFSSFTGWSAGVSLEEGIDLTIDYFMKETKVVQ